jgi:UDP-glucose 4-epimerase
MKIAVTGATGFLGSALVPQLLEVPEVEIRALTRTMGRAAYAHPRLTWMQGDLGSSTICGELVSGADAVLHLAHTNTPASSDGDYLADAHCNLTPNLTLLQTLARLNPTCHLVYASSGGAVYAPSRDRTPFTEDSELLPQSPYAVQKLTLEWYLRLTHQEAGVPVTILRISNPYGVLLSKERRQGFIGIAMRSAMEGRAITCVGSPDNVRDYLHIHDLGAAVRCALETPAALRVLNIGSGVGHSVREVVKMLEKVLGKSLPMEQRAGASVHDRVPWNVLNIDRARGELGWEPRIGLEEGLRRMAML